MPRYKSGELSKSLMADVDSEIYQTGAELQDGFITTPEGSTMCPGSIYVANTKGNITVRNYTFIYSQDDTYTLEFGLNYIRFYRLGGVVDDSGNPGNAYEVATTYTAAELPQLDFYQEYDTLYITHNNHQRAKLVRNDHDDWTLSNLEMIDGPFLLENDTLANTITPNALTGAVTCTTVQDSFLATNVGGLLRIDHDLAEQKVEGTISGTGASSSVYVQKGEFFQINVTGTYTATIEVQFSDDNATWETSSTYASIDDKQISLQYQNEDVRINDPQLAKQDQYVRINVTAYVSGTPPFLIASNAYTHRGVMVIGAFTSTKIVTGTILSRMGAVTATAKWREGSWSDRRGFPAVTDSEDFRLCHIGSKFENIRRWCSATNDPERHRTGELATDAFSHTLTGLKNPVRWIRQIDLGIQVGTTGSIATFRLIDQSAGVRANNPYKIFKKVAFPCGYIKPVETDFGLLVVARGGRNLGELLWRQEDQLLFLDDMTLNAKHILQVDGADGIVSIAYQRLPYPILWCVRSDGVFLAYSFNRLIEMQAWSRSGYRGLIETVSKEPQGNYDRIWLAGQYTINGSPVRFQCYMDELNLHKPIKDMHFSEAGLKWSGGSANVTDISQAAQAVVTLDAWPIDGDVVNLANGENIRMQDIGGMIEVINEIYEVSDANVGAKTFKLKDSAGVGYINTTGYTAYTSGGTLQEVDNTFAGIAHLNGEEAMVNSDGAYNETVEISGGTYTQDSYPNAVSVGLYNPRYFTPMPIESPKLYGKIKKIVALWLGLFRSTSGEVSRVDGDNAFDEDLKVKRDIDYSKVRDPQNTDLGVHTGLVRVDALFGSDERQRVSIKQKYPLPMTILSIDPEVT